MTLVAEREDRKQGVSHHSLHHLLHHPLRAEVVRGFAPWVGAAVLLTLAVTLAVESKQWQGGWAETRDELHIASGLLCVPLALAAGCWHGGRERRRGTGELLATAARGTLARLLASALPLALWVVAGYAIAAGLALLATWYCATGDSPYLIAPLTDAFVLAAATLLGQVVGRLVAWRLAAPLLAAGAYVVLGFLAYDSRRAVRYLSPVLDVSTSSVPVWWQPMTLMVWTGGLATAAVLAYAARRRWTALLPLAAATAAGALLVQTGDGLWHTSPLAGREVCDTSTTPQVCVNARYERLLPQVTDALSGLTDRLEGVRNLPVRYEDIPGEPTRDEAQLPIVTPIGWRVVRGQLTDPEQYAWEAGMMLSGRGECDEVDPRLDAVDNAVQHYLAPNPLEKQMDEQFAKWGDKADRARLDARVAARARLKAMGEEERRTWLSAYFATVDECDPGKVPTL
ncbi:hypothetical protein [Streptomyces sp. NL15-2K]|uniref:hypothetical protein n=1 Tax=Streptomyces sp. NL15-2K TaxID=376149 RepID=UPI000FFA95D6|nr:MULTISPECIES: hypothetical protein [Actinomycetes]WKX09145.1 hypothetical protein Q4V64_17250 [Kutzneria buriramensis]GCB49349.1 hypothetical protein SNL152K_6684 [Streptomyces sp. NL15-2K]